MMDKSNPMDWVFVLTLVQLFGLKWLLAATDGIHYFLDLGSGARKRALVAGMLTIWIPYLAVWVTYGHSPVDMWHGATAWWNFSDGSWIAKMFAITGWWLLLSPVQALVAMISIWRAEQREKIEQQKFAAYAKMMRDTGLW